MTDQEIFDLFNGRCIMCWHPATVINHVVLRSRSKLGINDWKNKVPLCSEDHDKYHKNGVSKRKQTMMINQRRRVLISLGKEEYV